MAHPLCPAGHLPLEGEIHPGRSLGHLQRCEGASVSFWLISPLEGEMPGRAEGVSRTHQGITPAADGHSNTRHFPVVIPPRLA